MTEKLLPCPFCGVEARIMLEEEDRPDDSFHNVYCTVCGAQFWVKSKTEAIAAWNRRADVAPVVRGEWGQCSAFDEDENVYTCSVCGEPWTLFDGTPQENNMHYCPNCGAKMESEGGT